MPRIRTIKPEFWDSPSTAQADLAVRLTYIAMWNWADDSGRGTANVKELEAFVFPNDDVRELPRKGTAGDSAHSRGNSAPIAGSWRSFAEVLGEVAEAYGVQFYKVKNRPYYVLPNFKDHQSKDFRAKSKYPTEAEGHFYDVTSGNPLTNATPNEATAGDSAHSRGNSAPIAGDSASVIGYKGNRVTGLKDMSDSSNTDVSPLSDEATTSVDESPATAVDVPSEEPSEPVPAKKPRRTVYPPEFEAFWAAYPKKAGKGHALKSWKKAIVEVDDVQTIIDGAKRYANDPNRNPQFTSNAQGWLTGHGWLDEPAPAHQPQWGQHAVQNRPQAPKRTFRDSVLSQLEQMSQTGAQDVFPQEPQNTHDQFQIIQGG